MKTLLKQVLPPALVKVLKPVLSYGWFGNYTSWKSAEQECTGYDTELIFDKIKSAALSVKNGKAKFERDGILFFEEKYNWRLLACLMQTAALNNGKLHVTDFGGSLGSSFFQHKTFFDSLKDVKWGVVEQEHFTSFGQRHLQDENLFFYHSVETCLQQQTTQILILSSVLQYLEKPFETLNSFLCLGYNYIFIDRTAFINTANHRLTVQKVNPAIYPASYPAWFFNEEIFLDAFRSNYSLLADFQNEDFTNKKGTYFKGFFFVRKLSQR